MKERREINVAEKKRLAEERRIATRKERGIKQSLVYPFIVKHKQARKEILIDLYQQIIEVYEFIPSLVASYSQAIAHLQSNRNTSNKKVNKAIHLARVLLRLAVRDRDLLEIDE